MAVVRYSSTSSFGGLGLSDEDCAEDDMAMDELLSLPSDASSLSHLCLSLCVSGTRTVRGQLSIQSSTRDPVLYTANSVFLFPENKPCSLCECE